MSNISAFIIAVLLIPVWAILGTGWLFVLFMEAHFAKKEQRVTMIDKIIALNK